MIKNVSPYIACEEDSFYGNDFYVELRHPKIGKKYLSVGSKCIVDGRFIFETEEGTISIGDRCHIGGGVTFISRSAIIVGSDVTIAWDVTIYDHNSHSVFWEERRNDTIQEYNDLKTCGDSIKNKDWSKVKTAPIVIKDKVWIGFGVTILKGVTIGGGAVIGAKSVVTRDIPPWTVAGGNPAKVIRHIGKLCRGSYGVNNIKKDGEKY